VKFDGECDPPLSFKEKRKEQREIKIKNTTLTLMNFTLAIALLLFLWTLTALAKHSLTSPYLAGAAAMTICVYLQASPPAKVIAVVLAYLLVYLLNEDVDINQLLARGEESSTELSSAHWMRVARVVTLIVFLWLPIPKAPGFLTGVWALLIVATLIYLNKDVWHRGTLPGFLILTTMSVGIAALLFWLLKMFWLVNTPMLPLIAGLAIPNLINPQYQGKSLAERGIDQPPGVSQVVYTFLLAWITPGLSLSAATNALIAPGVYRVLIANLVSVALEGWNLGLIIRGGGGTSAKTPLADLLLNTSKLTQSPALDGQGLGYGALGLVFLLGVLPAIVVYCLSTERIEPDPTTIIFIMVVQGCAASGLVAVILIPIGLGIALLQRKLMPDAPEVRSLVIIG
jgi:hypothetical protein